MYRMTQQRQYTSLLKRLAKVRQLCGPTTVPKLLGEAEPGCRWPADLMPENYIRAINIADAVILTAGAWDELVQSSMISRDSTLAQVRERRECTDNWFETCDVVLRVAHPHLYDNSGAPVP